LLSRTSINAVARMRREEWPLVLREFCAFRNAISPIEAAHQAASDLLKGSRDKNNSSSLIISVTHLCEALGIELVGARASVNRSSLELMELADTRTPLRRAKLRFSDSIPIIEVRDDHIARARLSVAHEIGHYLIHRRKDGMDWLTLRVSSTAEEETLAEYIGRLLLLPRGEVDAFFGCTVDAVDCLKLAASACVSIHAVGSRLLDPDRTEQRVAGVILWSMRHRAGESYEHPAQAFAPEWHICPDSFVPVGNCHIRRTSVIGQLAAKEQDVAGRGQEDVSIGTFKGTFRVDAFAWGSWENKTRKVLSIFYH
jgi:hypothetical protein